MKSSNIIGSGLHYFYNSMLRVKIHDLNMNFPHDQSQRKESHHGNLITNSDGRMFHGSSSKVQIKHVSQEYQLSL